MVKYLLFYSTYTPAPTSDLFDHTIKESINKNCGAKTIEFWNWTPEQKGLLSEAYRRMILTSHWSTGKTRIMFQKAKDLAMNDQTVLFVLFYSKITEAGFDSFGQYAPILLYCSLLNEIEQSDEKIKNNLKLCITNNLKSDVIPFVKEKKKKVNIFIDEYSVNSKQDLETIDELFDSEQGCVYTKFGPDTQKKGKEFSVDPSYYLWVTLGRVSAEVSSFFQKWLQQKSKNECMIPSLRHALRNSKEILSYAKTLEPEHKAEEEKEVESEDIRQFVASISPKDKEEILEAMEVTTVTANEIPKCGLPDPSWPRSDLLTSPNQPSGFSIPEPIVSSGPKTLHDDLKSCFDKLDSPKVLVIVLSQTIPSELVKEIKKIRSNAPLMADENFDFNYGE